MNLDKTPIDLIVPVYKNAALTKVCVESIVKFLPEIDEYKPRLIIINDSPDDSEVSRMLSSFCEVHPKVLVYTNDKNMGFVGTANKGLRLALHDGHDAILINSDTQTFPGTLKEIVDVAYCDPQIGFVSPRSNNASLCTLPHVYGGAVPAPVDAYNRWREIGLKLPKFHFTPTCVGFYLFIRYNILANFGILNERFGVGYEEENDLIQRASKCGYRAVLANHAFAYHAGSASFNLRNLNLHDHRNSNLETLIKEHPEFLPLVRRYEASPHYRAESLLSELIPSGNGSIRVVVDLAELGFHFNGTNELAISLITRLAFDYKSRFDLNVICREDVFKFHALDKIVNLQRHDSDTPERFGIAIRLGQPFNLHHTNTLEVLAPINIFGMLDTIAEDCGHLSIDHNFSELWGHVARTANGLFFISKTAERAFLNRYPDSLTVPRYTSLLPTKISCYSKPPKSGIRSHVLILGNHFPHKASDVVVRLLSVALPSTQLIVLGGDTYNRGNVKSYRSGTLDNRQMKRLLETASVVVLPSHTEGFGFGLLHALANHKPVVARAIEATREILDTYHSFDGVFLFKNNLEVVEKTILAMRSAASSVDDRDGITWDSWTDGFAKFCVTLVGKEEVFKRLERRIYSADLLRQRQFGTEDRSPMVPRLVAEPPISTAAVDDVPVDQLASTELVDASSGDVFVGALNGDPRASSSKDVAELDASALLSYDGSEFIEKAYQRLLGRPPDVAGLNNYLSELSEGISKLTVLERINRSSEAKGNGASLPGLRKKLLLRRLHSLPLISLLVRQ